MRRSYYHFTMAISFGRNYIILRLNLLLLKKSIYDREKSQWNIVEHVGHTMLKWTKKIYIKKIIMCTLYGQSTIDILRRVLLNLPTLLQCHRIYPTHKLTKKNIQGCFFFLEELGWSVPFPNSWLCLQLWVSPNSQFLGIFPSPKGDYPVEAFTYVPCPKPLLPLLWVAKMKDQQPIILQLRRWQLLLPPTSSPQSLNALPSDLTRSVTCLERRFLFCFALPLEFSFLGKP